MVGSKVKITSNNPIAVDTKIEVDGVPMQFVRRASLVFDSGKVIELHLELLTSSVEYEGGAEVRSVTTCPRCKEEMK